MQFSPTRSLRLLDPFIYSSSKKSNATTCVGYIHLEITLPDSHSIASQINRINEQSRDRDSWQRSLQYSRDERMVALTPTFILRRSLVTG